MVLVDLKLLSKEKENIKLSGKDGYCFIFNDVIIKIYRHPKNKSDVTDWSSYQSSMISFPKRYLVDGKGIIGELMPFFEGELLVSAINLKTKLSLLYNHYYEMIKEIRNYPEIKMNDMGIVNILYSEKKGFKLIDVTEWKKDINQIDNNIRLFDYSLICVIFDQILIPGSSILRTVFPNNVLKYGKDGQEFIKLKKKCLIEREYHFLEMMEAYNRMYKIHYSMDLKTIDNMKNYTKLLKKD